jgi:hypothetical protein
MKRAFLFLWLLPAMVLGQALPPYQHNYYTTNANPAGLTNAMAFVRTNETRPVVFPGGIWASSSPSGSPVEQINIEGAELYDPLGNPAFSWAVRTMYDGYGNPLCSFASPSGLQLYEGQFIGTATAAISGPTGGPLLTNMATASLALTNGTSVPWSALPAPVLTNAAAFAQPGKLDYNWATNLPTIPLLPGGIVVSNAATNIIAGIVLAQPNGSLTNAAGRTLAGQITDATNGVLPASGLGVLTNNGSGVLGWTVVANGSVYDGQHYWQFIRCDVPSSPYFASGGYNTGYGAIANTYGNPGNWICQSSSSPGSGSYYYNPYATLTLGSQMSVTNVWGLMWGALPTTSHNYLTRWGWITYGASTTVTNQTLPAGCIIAELIPTGASSQAFRLITGKGGVYATNTGSASYYGGQPYHTTIWVDASTNAYLTIASNSYSTPIETLSAAPSTIPVGQNLMEILAILNIGDSQTEYLYQRYFGHGYALPVRE